MLENLDFIFELGKQIKKALISGDSYLFGQLMHKHWEKKRTRTKGMTNSYIDDAYEFGLQNGAIGGKVVGAGGGGFLMFYAAEREVLRQAMANKGLQEVRFSFDYEGTKIVMS